MRKRSKGSNNVEHVPSVSKALGWIQSTKKQKQKRGVHFV